jgi:hypothetical protein
MKKILATALLASVSFAAVPGLAQTAIPIGNGASEIGVAYLATQAIGTKVMGADGQMIGKVIDMGLSKSGRAEYVVIEPMGQDGPRKTVAIKYSEFGWDESRQILTLDMSESQLRRMLHSR